MIISASGHNVLHCCAAARKIAGLKLADTREVLRSGGEDGLYRVILADGTIVECTLVQHSTAQAFITQ